MAVFPDRIVLKNSTDDQATITAAIESGGTDEIVQGELVLGLEATSVTLYTKASDGSIVNFSPTSAAGRAIVSDDAPTIGINGLPLADGDLWYESDTGSYYVYYLGAWVEVSGGGGGSGIENIIEDTTPQLGGNLDVNGYYVSSAGGGDVEIAPDSTGNFIVRGNDTDGSITLNCTANTHGVTIQSPPHSDAATYSLVLPATAGTAGQVLTSQGGAQLTWENAGGGATSIDDLSDVDTSSIVPAEGQALVWNSTDGEWQPGTVSGGGGGGSGAGIYLVETETSTGGQATFTGLGYSGILQKVSSTVDAWIVLYTSAAERTADSSRVFADDPATGSGVLAEFYITAGTTVLATPGTTYLNNDTSLTEAIYAAVRTQAGVAVVSDVTISAYGLAAITAVSGGTFGSGV